MSAKNPTEVAPAGYDISRMQFTFRFTAELNENSEKERQIQKIADAKWLVSSIVGNNNCVKFRNGLVECVIGSSSR